MPERSEAPTPRRRAEARRKGQVAKSGEVNSALILLAGVLYLSSYAGHMVSALMGMMQAAFITYLVADSPPWLRSGSGPALTPDGLGALGLNLALTIGTAIGPFLATLLGVGLIANLVQVGWMITPEALSPSFSRLNPLAGLSRLWSRRGAVELGKAFVKVALVGYVAADTFSNHYGTLMRLSEMDLPGALGVLRDLAADLGRGVGGLILVLAIADYIWQRRSFEQSLRMTRQEVIEELKSAEGQPLLRLRLRQKQRQYALRRMMQAVPKADVVVVNPIHFAVALSYDARKMGAPTVVAKGRRLIAEQIVKLAQQHRVPIVQNAPLARALYLAVEVGAQIPAALYHAVAEVLAFVYRLKQKQSAQ